VAHTIHPSPLAAAAHQNNGASNRIIIWSLPAGTGNPRNATKDQEGLIIPVVITIFSDRSFIFITKTPPVPVLIKRAVNLAKGSAEPHKNKVGKITQEQVKEIAKIKTPDLNCFDLEAAMRSVAGTARSMGVDVV
jgi:large subunit ribosomal protein L11